MSRAAPFFLSRRTSAPRPLTGCALPPEAR